MRSANEKEVVFEHAQSALCRVFANSRGWEDSFPVGLTGKTIVLVT